MPTTRYLSPIGLVGKGYRLIIAEKPKAAKRIAEALSYGKARKYYYKGVPYWYFTLGYSKYVVASAVGHLFTLTTSLEGFPVFEYYWAPIWEVEDKASYAKKYYELLAILAKYAIEYINACDYDIEGSVIGYMIIRSLGDVRRAKRMKFSSLTDTELRRSFNQLGPLDTPMIEAGLCRHELDWIWGINVSRALMRALQKTTGRRISLSAGRVQSPTLIEVVRRERERKLHVPKPKPVVSVTVLIGSEKVPVELVEPKPETLIEARELAKALKQQGFLYVSSVSYSVEKLQPPPPFNLGDLQSEAARIYGYSPLTTQRIAEQLYLDALISYPRTNSQKLPPTLNHLKILEKISSIGKYGTLVRKLIAETRGVLRPRQGVKDDPAHPAIYPTGVKPAKLSIRQWRIYDLIVRRYLACFAKPAVIEGIRALLLGPKKTLFKLTIKSLRYPGWITYYPYTPIEARTIPKITKGMRLKISRVAVKVTYSSPPEPYTRAKIVKWMETVNIGTEGTRARIAETLFERKYLEVKSGKVTVTPLGFAVAEVLEEYFKDLTSIELTRKFEQFMEEIRLGRRSRSQVVNEAKKTLLKLFTEYNNRIEEVGLKLGISLGLLQPKKKCLLCSREAISKNLCTYHLQALNQVIESYNTWHKILGITWSEYLVKLLKLKGTGEWVKDIVKALLSNTITLNQVYQ